MDWRVGGVGTLNKGLQEFFYAYRGLQNSALLSGVLYLPTTVVKFLRHDKKGNILSLSLFYFFLPSFSIFKMKFSLL